MHGNELLVRRARKGDADAFEALMAPHERKIYFLCLRMLGNREDALDCAQEAMLRIWRSMATYRGEAAFTTWMYRIATNACLDMLRRQKARPAVPLETFLETNVLASDDRDGPVEQAEASARKQAIEQGLARLSDTLRAAIVLRDVQGLSYEEISGVLDTPVGTVKSRINRARERLREILARDMELFATERVYTGEGRKSI